MSTRKQRAWAFALAPYCQYCGVDMVAPKPVPFEALPPNMYTSDHVIPRSDGGPDHMSNEVLCCSACNGLKANHTMAEFRRTGRIKRHGQIETLQQTLARAERAKQTIMDALPIGILEEVRRRIPRDQSFPCQFWPALFELLVELAPELASAPPPQRQRAPRQSRMVCSVRIEGGEFICTLGGVERLRHAFHVRHAESALAVWRRFCRIADSARLSPGQRNGVAGKLRLAMREVGVSPPRFSSRP